MSDEFVSDSLAADFGVVRPRIWGCVRDGFFEGFDGCFGAWSIFVSWVGEIGRILHFAPKNSTPSYPSPSTYSIKN